MSNQDSFINEVSEEVRRDRLFKVFRKYGWIGAVLVVVIVGGAAWNEWRKSGNRAETEAAGDALSAALNLDDAQARRAELAALDTGGNTLRASLIGLLVADTALDAGDRSGALEILDDIVDDPSVPASVRDLAALKWAILGPGHTDPEDRIARLNAIVLEGGAYRLLALEQVAIAEVERGNTEAALSHLREIVDDAGVMQNLRIRASQLIVALGGDAEAG